jgi:hypothetical protein
MIFTSLKNKTGNLLKRLPLFLCITAFLPTYAQKLEIGIGGGVMNYKGDVAPGFYPQFSRPAGSIFVRHNPSHAVSFKLSLAYGNIYGDDLKSNDDYAKARGWLFSTQIAEAALEFEYNFLNFRDFTTRKYGSPYIHFGVAGVRFDEKSNPNPTYSNTQLAIPFGVGYRRVITGNLNLGIEFGARKTFTDYLDNYGGDIVNSRFSNGNPFKNDMYFSTQIMLSYTFYSIQCPYPRK